MWSKQVVERHEAQISQVHMSLSGGIDTSKLHKHRGKKTSSRLQGARPSQDVRAAARDIVASFPLTLDKPYTELIKEAREKLKAQCAYGGKAKVYGDRNLAVLLDSEHLLREDFTHHKPNLRYAVGDASRRDILSTIRGLEHNERELLAFEPQPCGVPFPIGACKQFAGLSDHGELHAGLYGNRAEFTHQHGITGVDPLAPIDRCGGAGVCFWDDNNVLESWRCPLSCQLTEEEQVIYRRMMKEAQRLRDTTYRSEGQGGLCYDYISSGTKFDTTTGLMMPVSVAAANQNAFVQHIGEMQSFLKKRVMPKVYMYFPAPFILIEMYLRDHHLSDMFGRCVNGVTSGHSYINFQHIDDDIGHTVLIAGTGQPSHGAQFGHGETGLYHETAPGDVVSPAPAEPPCHRHPVSVFLRRTAVSRKPVEAPLYLRDGIRERRS